MVPRSDSRPSEAAYLTACEEIGHGPARGPPRVTVADVGGEELDEASGRVIARLGDDGRDDRPAVACRNAPLGWLHDLCLRAHTRPTDLVSDTPLQHQTQLIMLKVVQLTIHCPDRFDFLYLQMQMY